MNVIPLNIPDRAHIHRHYCVSFSNAFVKHKDVTTINGIGTEWVEAFHNNKKLNLDQKDYQKAGRYDLFYSDTTNTDHSFDEVLDNVFLLYDPAGLNYAHFFFDYFGKVLYYDELLKSNPNLKLGIPEDYYEEEGNSNFIKQWLDLYYSDKNINIVVLKKDKRYRVDKLIIPGTLYGFPEPEGDNFIMEKIIETVKKVPVLEVKTNGCYISRQDTIKRGWYHKRDLVNEVELIDKIKEELNYDIIELMDYDIIGKIQIFKSYKNIVQQSSASNVNILFSGPENNNIILTNPRMGPWLNYKLTQFSNKCKAGLTIIEDAGEYIVNELDPNQADKDNYPWQLVNIEGIVQLLKQVDNGEV